MSEYLQQRTPAWLKARRGKLTASNAGAAVGLNPYCSPQQLFEQLTDKVPPFEGNICTRWGNTHEPNAIFEYSLMTKSRVESTGFWVHRHYKWLGGSPDGFVGETGVVEAKCPFSKKPYEKPPLYYYLQCNVLMEVTDRDFCDFVAWTPELTRVIRFKRNRDCFEYLLPYYQQFAACINNDMPPTQVTEEDKERRRATVAKFMEDDIVLNAFSNPPTSDDAPESDVSTA